MDMPDPSRVLGNARDKVDSLVLALKKHEEETLSKQPVSEAMTALDSLVSMLQAPQPSGDEWVMRKRRVLGIIDPLNNQALLIALGAMKKPFEETLEHVKQAVREVDKKIKPTELDPRGQSGR